MKNALPRILLAGAASVAVLLSGCGGSFEDAEESYLGAIKRIKPEYKDAPWPSDSKAVEQGHAICELLETRDTSPQAVAWGSRSMGLELPGDVNQSRWQVHMAVTYLCPEHRPALLRGE